MFANLACNMFERYSHMLTYMMVLLRPSKVMMFSCFWCSGFDIRLGFQILHALLWSLRYSKCRASFSCQPANICMFVHRISLVLPIVLPAALKMFFRTSSVLDCSSDVLPAGSDNSARSSITIVECRKKKATPAQLNPDTTLPPPATPDHTQPHRQGEVGLGRARPGKAGRLLTCSLNTRSCPSCVHPRTL